MKTNKAALIIGINYNGTNSQLNGCVNDAERLNRLLVSDLNYPADSITLLTDKENSTQLPTRSNIVEQVTKLATRAKDESINEIWISFSGHGTYTNDRNKDEKDGKDELLVPSDYTSAGFISDDEWNILLSKFPSSCSIFNILDCCHSGTLADLKYYYYYDFVKGRRKRIKKKVRVRVRYRRRYKWRRKWKVTYQKIPDKWIWKGRTENSKERVSAHVLTLSGCRDPQTSADAYLRDRNEWGGALTNAFCNLIEETDNKITCQTLCHKLNVEMKKTKMTQKPTLACSQKINKTDLFLVKKPTLGFIQ